MTDGRGRARRRGGRVALALLGAYGVLVLVLMHSVGRTADETSYLMAGRAILETGWEHPFTRLHGPLPLLANQLFVPEIPPSDLHGRLPFEVVARGRLGMLPFGLVAGWIVFLAARRLFGAAGGLLSLALFVVNPLMLGYGALMAVDMAYTAGVLAALWLAGRFVERPTLGRGAAAGAGLGAACATKYLALFCVPLVLAAVAAGAARAPGRRPRVARALLAAAGVALVSLVTLHACYGFTAGTAPRDGDAYSSAAISRAVETPVVGALVAALPEPYLVGADYQMRVGGGRHRPYLEGEYAPGHPDYYLHVLLHKTPEWLLVLFAAVAGGWLLRGGRPRSRAELVALALGLPAALALLVYLSFFTRLQIGVRYVLPLYPLAFVACGAAARPLARRPRAAWTLGAVALAWTAWDLGTQWPNLIAYYNASSGGQAEGWRRFADSNSEWGQYWTRGPEILREREGEDLELLSRAAGPRFGRVAIHIDDLTAPDPEDPDRARHWLHAFEPVDHVGAAWWVYDVSPEDWAARLAEREGGAADRERAEYALALLGAGRLEEARAQVAGLPAGRAAPLRELLRRLEDPPADAGAVHGLANLWMALGRPDRAEDLLRRHPAVAGDPLRDRARARALALARRTEEAVRLLSAADLSGASDDVFLLVSLHRDLLQWRAALDALERWAPTLPEEDRERVEAARERIGSELALQEELRAMVGG